MANLPPKSSFTGTSVTQGQFKTALDTLNDYLTGLLGSDGTAATAKAALGVVTPTPPTATEVVTALGYTPYNVASAAAKLDKTGGTMTGSITLASGAVIYSSQSGAADNARNTGYKMNDGQDIGEMNRSNQYIDDRVSNCNGYVGNGNCQSNPNWTPPNGNWWEWYSVVGGTAWANNGSYDGVGGTTYAYNPVSVSTNYDAYYLGADEIGGGEYHRNYRNCNCGAFNCRTNCNCNCACACCGCC
jgi:hypothetical protein